MNTSLVSVITTIQQPTISVLSLAEHMNQVNGTLIVAGDAKGPKSFDLPGVEFLSLKRQIDSSFSLARFVPTNHYARKNIGYLQAISYGALCIYETDDDNLPLPNWSMRHEEVEAKAIGRRGLKTEVRRQRSDGRNKTTEIRQQKWINVYKYFTDENIWPRGFPLDEINSVLPLQAPSSELHAQLRAPIQQGLVNNSPDVDAIWRLIFNRPLAFQQCPSVYLPPQCWCPFNSQSTWWWPIAYPLLYLPSYCSFRMTDIWRSFIAQRCLWEMGYGVVFHAPEATQERNAHNLMKDFKDEIPGYIRNKEFVSILEKLKLDKGEGNVKKNLLRCYDELVRAEFFHKKEMELVNTWLEDLERASY